MSEIIPCFLLVREGERWKRADTGEILELRDAGPGAMWFATWLDLEGTSPQRYYGFDNQFSPPLIVRTPGGDWNVDSRASNCTLPNDKIHRCWCRHGEAPNITVDKNGATCAAGAGSIISGDYHGFLRDGKLIRC
jgi:hypothetical protein